MSYDTLHHRFAYEEDVMSTMVLPALRDRALACDEDSTSTVTFPAIQDDILTMVLPAVALPARTGRVTVLVPAHNEAATVAHVIYTLRQQTRLPDEIIVICDNCTDDTEAIADSLESGLSPRPGTRTRRPR